GLSALNLGTCGKIRLDWNKSNAVDFNNYNVYQSLSHMTNVSSLTPAAKISGIDTNTYTRTGLADGTRYYFAVTAVDTSGNENKTTINDANAVPSCNATALFSWAQEAGAWGQSTAKVSGSPDNNYDSTDANILGGTRFNTPAGSQASVLHSTVADFNSINALFTETRAESTLAQDGEADLNYTVLGKYSETSETTDRIKITDINGIETNYFEPGQKIKLEITTIRLSNTNNTNQLTIIDYLGNTLDSNTWIQTSTVSPYKYYSSINAPITANYYSIEANLRRSGRGQPRFNSRQAIDTILSGNFKTYCNPERTIECIEFDKAGVIYARMYGTGGTVSAANSSMTLQRYDNSSQTITMPAVNRNGNWYDFNISLTGLTLTTKDWYELRARLRDAASTEIARASRQIAIKQYKSTGSYENLVDLNQPITIQSINWNRVLNGQSLTLSYKTSNDNNAWSAWSIDYNSSPTTVNTSARYLKYRATLTTTQTDKTPYLLDVNAVASNPPDFNIYSVELLWSHEVAAAEGSQSAIYYSSSADFNSGNAGLNDTFVESTLNQDGEVDLNYTVLGKYSETSETTDRIKIMDANNNETNYFTAGQKIKLEITTIRLSNTNNTNQLTIIDYQGNTLDSNTWIQTSVASPYKYYSSINAPATANHYTLQANLQMSGGGNPRFISRQAIDSNLGQYFKVYCNNARTIECTEFSKTGTVYARIYGSGATVSAANSSMTLQRYDNSSQTITMPAVNRNGNWYDFNISLSTLTLTTKDWYELRARLRDAASTEIARASRQIAIKQYKASGTYTKTVDFNSVKAIKQIAWRSQGQPVTAAFQTSDDNLLWSSWSSDYNSPAAVNANARYLRNRFSFSTADTSSTPYLLDYNVTFAALGSFTDDHVMLSYGLSNYNDVNAVDYNSTNAPADKMDSNTDFIKKIDVTNSRPSGGSWQWADFNSLKVGGRYYRAGAADGNFRLDAVGVKITYFP
ncbi:hypothetical protein HZB89_00155, partial [archaeon]|nr:hypothetical protein [archaeon]